MDNQKITMTKKDFNAIAEVIRIALDTFRKDLDENKIESREYALSKGAEEGIKMLTEALAVKLVSINPRFDFNKFYSACGIYN